jgi:hypothetical protein
MGLVRRKVCICGAKGLSLQVRDFCFVLIATHVLIFIVFVVNMFFLLFIFLISAV